MTTGLLIPLYTYPTDESWESVKRTKRTFPSLPIIAVVNPHNGAGQTQLAAYAQGIPDLQDAQVIVLGYVYTEYAQRDISLVKTEISLFRSWYHADGVFFDQAASQPGLEGYYSVLSEHARSLGMSVTVSNPGTRAPSYVGTADLLVTYERSGLPPSSLLQALPVGSESHAAIAYDVPALDEDWLAEAEGYLQYLYVTDKGMPNPYNALPSYFQALAARLAEG